MDLEDHLFQAQSIKINNITVQEMKTLDQFGDSYKDLIEKHNTAKSICGYVVCATSIILSELAEHIMDEESLSLIHSFLIDPDYMLPRVENVMKFIQHQRSGYLKNYPEEFETESEFKGYITDWVAKYEISDYIQQAPNEKSNIFFQRFCAYEYPECLDLVKHEELRRLEEEKPFAGSRILIETFSPERKLYTAEQFKNEKIIYQLLENERPLVFVGDLEGHFVTFLICNYLNDQGKLEPRIFLFNSVKESYLKFTEVFELFCNLITYS